MLVHGFAPVVGWNAKVLIVGTLPGGDSLRLHQYYANTGNAFWFIMRQLLDITGSYDERLEGLVKNRIAIWDVLQRAERSGSIDAAIVRGTEVPNDFAAFFRAHSSIKTIFFNGGRAEKLYRNLVLPRFELGTQTPRSRLLPSTSPANTHSTREAKAESWRVVQVAVTD